MRKAVSGTPLLAILLSHLMTESHATRGKQQTRIPARESYAPPLRMHMLLNIVLRAAFVHVEGRLVQVPDDPLETQILTAIPNHPNAATL